VFVPVVNAVVAQNVLHTFIISYSKANSTVNFLYLFFSMFAQRELHFAKLALLQKVSICQLTKKKKKHC
jgi:hypothetical protein